MELRRKLDFCFDLHGWVWESLLSELNTELVDSGLGCLILILHVGMHVSEKELLITLICELQPDTLIGGLALGSQTVIGLHKRFQNLFVKHLNLHL